MSVLVSTWSSVWVVSISPGPSLKVEFHVLNLIQELNAREAGRLNQLNLTDLNKMRLLPHLRLGQTNSQLKFNSCFIC